MIQYLVLLGLVALIVTGGLMALEPPGAPVYWVTRATSLLGYQAIFLSIVSSAYVRQMRRVFGRPFVQVHHVLSVTGLALATLHPLAVAWESASLRVFLPSFDSWSLFFQLGGRMAWPLIVVASLAAVLRRTIGRNWRVVHYLNYAAFWLATIHALMIGTDFRYLGVRILSIAMTLTVIAIFVQKRLWTRRR
jgi:DMSO/TMAO reductase YedYZ heme-binding membrane subunit